MPKQYPAKITKLSVSLPFGIGNVEWEPDPTERRAAWSLYVELVTRIAIQYLHSDEGLDRDALSSLYSLFGTTREILRVAGPAVGASRQSVGGIAITVLNDGVRPYLARWHPELEEWEAQLKQGVSKRDHEKAWPQHDEFRAELRQLGDNLRQYTDALAEIAGV